MKRNLTACLHQPYIQLSTAIPCMIEFKVINQDYVTLPGIEPGLVINLITRVMSP